MHHKWNSLTKRQTKEVNPALFFAILGECTGTACSPRSTICTAIWKFQSLHGKLPDDAKQVDELENIANSLISEAEVNKQVLISEPRELLRYVFIHVVNVLLTVGLQFFVDHRLPRIFTRMCNSWGNVGSGYLKGARWSRASNSQFLRIRWQHGRRYGLPNEYAVMFACWRWLL